MGKLEKPKNKKPLDELEYLIKELRGEHGCPWDKKQTPFSVLVYLIGEVYELLDAVISESSEHVKEEMGDVLFQIIFLSHFYSEMDKFSLDDVIWANIEKMRRRHPHVFGNEVIQNIEQVRKRWYQIKASENNKKNDTNSLLKSVPKSLPSLSRAYRLSEQVAEVGFDWDNIEEVLEQVKEELNEFINEVKFQAEGGHDKKKCSIELGDILFTMVNLARFAEIHPELALIDSIQKFERRFRFMEKTALKEGKKLEDLSKIDWDILWQEAKIST